MNKYLLPLKREVWEHHGSFIRMPIIVVIILTALLLLMGLAAGKGISDSSLFNFNLSYNEESFNDGAPEIRHFEYNDKVIGEANILPAFNQSDFGELQQGLKISSQSPYILMNGIMMLVAFSFLLSCLISDRKDNSILFWKSMPVSETQNVINKVFVVTLLLPAITWVAAFILSIALFIITISLALWSGMEGLPSAIWRDSSILATAWSYIGTYLAISLWLLPVTAWFLCASAIAKKNVFLTAILPAILIVIIENYLLGSHYFVTTFVQHMCGLIEGQGNPFMLINPEGWSQLGQVISTSQFWIALPIIAAFIYASIWFRENRYEG